MFALRLIPRLITVIFHLNKCYFDVKVKLTHEYLIFKSCGRCVSCSVLTLGDFVRATCFLNFLSNVRHFLRGYRNVRRDVTTLIGWQRSHRCHPRCDPAKALFLQGSVPYLSSYFS